MSKEKVKYDFLSSFDKEVKKMEHVSTNDDPPRYWHSFGNYAINRVMSGSLYNGIPQGRITALCGPSSAGKSFLAANLIREAQKEGAFVLILDTENALDKDFVSKIGVDPTDPMYRYTAPVKIVDCTSVVSNFLAGYKAQFGNDPDAPPVLIVLDSCDGSKTTAEFTAAEKGEIQFDQGQKPKMIKSMLMNWMSDIKSLNVSVVVTKQVYRASQEQLLRGEGAWVVNDAIRFPCSQILLATRLKLKDDKTKDVTGIRLKVEGFKTRFCLGFSNVQVDVPYMGGMSKYSGVFEMAIALGVIIKKGSWYNLEGDPTMKNYRAADIENNEQLMEEIVAKCEQLATQHVDVDALLDGEYVEMSTGEIKKLEEAEKENF